MNLEILKIVNHLMGNDFAQYFSFCWHFLCLQHCTALAMIHMFLKNLISKLALLSLVIAGD